MTRNRSGVDLALIEAMLRLTPEERLRVAAGRREDERRNSSVRRKTNQLRGFIFTDGTIETLARSGSELEVVLRDYCDGLVRLTFRGVSRVEVGDVDGSTILDARIVSREDGWQLALADDDGEALLVVAYASVEIAPLGTG